MIFYYSAKLSSFGVYPFLSSFLSDFLSDFSATAFVGCAVLFLNFEKDVVSLRVHPLPNFQSPSHFWFSLHFFVNNPFISFHYSLYFKRSPTRQNLAQNREATVDETPPISQESLVQVFMSQNLSSFIFHIIFLTTTIPSKAHNSNLSLPLIFLAMLLYKQT